MNKIFLLTLLIIITSCNASRKEDKPAGNNPLNNPPTETAAPGIEQLGGDKYEILSTHHNATMKNYHVLVVDPKIDSAYLQNFADKFRKQYCELQCNIMLYNDRAVAPFVRKHPLPDSDYVRLADHFIASSAFEPTAIKLYPFRDDRYKRLKGSVVK